MIQVSRSALMTDALVTASAGAVGMPVAAYELQVQIITDAAALAALEPEWTALHGRAGAQSTAFQSFAWAWHWQRSFLPPNDGRGSLAIATVRRKGQLIAIWPLVRRRLGPLVQLKWLGEPVTQYCDVIAAPLPDLEAVLAESWAEIVALLQPHLVSLRKVRDDAVIAPYLAGLGFHVSAEEEAPYLDLASASSADAFEERFGGKARKNRRRLLRRLEEQGSIGFEVAAPGAEASDYAIVAIDLKRQWVERRGEVSRAFLCPKLAAFFAALAADTRNGAGCRISALKLDGQPLSIQIAVRSGDRLLMHVIAHRHDAEKWGAGVLHMERTMRDCFAEGFGRLDLLAPNQPYKLDWADGVVPVRDHVRGYGLIGRAVGHAYDARLRSTAKSVLERLPPALRQRLTNAYARLSGA